MLRSPQRQFIGPEDLAVCQRVFDQISADARIGRDTDDGKVLASAVLTFFQRGFVEHDKLLAAVLGYRDDLTKEEPTPGRTPES